MTDNSPTDSTDFTSDTLTDSLKPRHSFAKGALVVSLLSLFLPIFLATLGMFGIMPVPWNATWPIFLTFFGCGSVAIASLIVSIIARDREKTWNSLAAIWISLLAFPVVLFATWLVAMIALANHPV